MSCEMLLFKHSFGKRPFLEQEPKTWSVFSEGDVSVATHTKSETVTL